MKPSNSVLSAALLIAVGMLEGFDAALRSAEGGQGLISGELVSLGDMEIQSRYEETSNETQITLALRPSGPHGTALLLFWARHEGRMLRKTPGEVSVLAYLGRFTVDPTRSRSPGLVFVFDPGGLHPATLDLSGRLRFTFLTGRPGGPIDDATATMTFVEFVQLVRAPRITAQIFGLDFPLRADQLKVLWQFAEQIFPRSSQQGRVCSAPGFLDRPSP